MYPRDLSSASFFYSIISATLSNSVLEFDTPIFGEKIKGRKIIVRPCYEQIFHEIQSKQTKSRYRFVTGTSGVGKSLFAIYCIRQYLPTHPVLYQHAMHGEARPKPILFYNNNVYMLTDEHVRYILDLKCVYVSDAVIPLSTLHPESITIFVSSHKEMMFHQFVKQHSVVPLYMPL